MTRNDRNPRLTHQQLEVLTAARGRRDRLAETPEGAGRAFDKAVTALLRQALLEEVPAKRKQPGWRQDESGNPIAAKLTAAGLAAISGPTKAASAQRASV